MKNKDLKYIFENTTLKCDPDPSKKAIYDEYGCKILTLLEVLPDDVEINGISYLEQAQFSSKDGFENFIKSDKDEVERTLDKLADRLTEWTQEWVSKHPLKAPSISKGKRRAISITVGAISGLFFMAIGLICAFCWLKTEKDTVYFVIESLKDIIGGLGVGTFTSKSISKNGKQTIGKFVSVVSFALLGISALGVIVLIVFACLALFSKETYIYFEICFMILSFIGLCCMIFNNPDKKSATAN